MDQQAIIRQVQALLERDPHVDLHKGKVDVAFVDGQVQLSGHVADIRAKRYAYADAVSVVGDGHVDDKLTVAPSEWREDGAIRAWLIQQFTDEPVFKRCAMEVWHKESMERVRDVEGIDGVIRITVEKGVVTLGGHVISLSHKRMASLLAWWAPGSVNVENYLTIVPEEEDNDSEISDAVRLALDKDPLVHSDRITIATRNGRVILNGVVAGQQERAMAENDVWYMSRKVKVQNDLQVEPGSRTGTRAPVEERVD